MKTIKDELAKLTVTGTSGAGLVEATVNGEFTLQKLTISDAALAMNDKNTLEVLITSAVNDAVSKAKEATEAKSREILQNIERH